MLLGSEIEYIKAYLDFHMLRFSDDKIDFKIDISVTEANVLVPPLIFITFLENTFRHGKAATLENPTKINININEGFLYYSIQNLIEKEREFIESGGSGLVNLKKRLNLIYVDNYILRTATIDAIFFAEFKIPIKL